MKNSRISGFQWAMMVFVFFVITMALAVILRDFQVSIGVKRFVFDIKDLAPLIASIVCILVFKYKKEQLAGLKFSFSLKVIERIILALILPLIILMIGMYSFNTFADSFILLQTSDLSVSLITILIGHILMAFVTEFGFRSYLQNILETKMNTFFASIVVGIIYSIFTANTTYGLEYAGYHFLYTFAFSMIIGELIRATQGRTIYIATVFHAAMTFALVFLFSEETGDLFSMKVIAISTTLVGVVFIVLSLIIRAIVYKTTKQSLEEVEPNNYLDHTEEDDFGGVNNRSKEADSEKENVEKPKDESHSAVDSEQTHTDNSDLKDSASYTEDRHSSVVSDVKDEINEAEEQTTEDSTKKE
ncbi:CPBP family intramembrane glutamic endopeptidase [Staphylococcus caprae]|uniref:CPBP family intramembrane glutamic endopeptidase n=1 Tax=Staphylococcus TaxID=1279 RepID=UPI0008A8A052|nr:MULTISPECIES: type II CAAX endopeptidase family protein [Staphylococcus]OHO69533.1 lysostaphin resistance protein A [Staphylococcus sp. HMSC036D05]